ncbi:MAG: nucleotidyltransferase domain-containing protein [Hormoscilla sp. SP5CHS1]|nr:nucleotidyltransferase domain-containing protein [Hormoscilla sp. SP12CHS1]MBC6455172.1 nucleotidyltransferase domain-containing protein [Hormoscilla sp. SP5CHS1]
MKVKNIEIAKEKIAEFCDRWQITEFALFGSVLRDDFRPDSDIDVLVTWDPNFHFTLSNLDRMESELEAIFERKVDLVSKLWRDISYIFFSNPSAFFFAVLSIKPLLLHS